MGRESVVILPKLKRILSEVGENIRLARLRRRFSAEILAERANMSRNTLRAIEAGSANVTFGAYVNALLCLGLESDLTLLARDDEFGRKLQDANLTTRERAPKIAKTNSASKKKQNE